MRARIVVDAVDHVVLDGHHRLAVAHRLGLQCVPVLKVDPTGLEVSRRGTHLPITHADVVAHVRQNGLMPARSTKYELGDLDVSCDVPIDRLRHPPDGLP